MESEVDDNEIVMILQQVNVESVCQLKEKKRSRVKDQHEKISLEF